MVFFYVFAGCLGVHCVFTGKAIYLFFSRYYLIFFIFSSTLVILLCNDVTTARVSNNYTLKDLNDKKNPRFLTIIIQNFMFYIKKNSYDVIIYIW